MGRPAMADLGQAAPPAPPCVLHLSWQVHIGIDILILYLKQKKNCKIQGYNAVLYTVQTG